MMISHLSKRVAGFLAACATAGVALTVAAAPATPSPQKNDGKKVKKPSLSVKATPPVGFSPARIVAVAELKGGPDDYEDYYCATVEWEWGDETRSETTQDCDPFESGRSRIKRQFTTDHVFRESGNYRITVRLKRSARVLVAASTNVQVKGGLGDPGGFGPP